MKPGITRWKADPLKWSGFPDLPTPFSPVQRARKFSAVFGTTSALNSITILPAGAPPIVMSKNTLGFAMVGTQKGRKKRGKKKRKQMEIKA